MISESIENEVNCIALGGLEGAKFDQALTSVRSDLRQLKRFVSDSCAAVDVAPGPMTSLGYEVHRDALVVRHVEKSLFEAVSQLIALLAMTRRAADALETAVKG